MKKILYLVHRIPYPPDKGDKIRSYHLLKHLSKSYRVFLGSFVDDTEDWRYEEIVRGMCESACLRPLNPLRARVRSLRGFVSDSALTIPFYKDREMQAWVDHVLECNEIEQVVIFSSAMAQYVSGPRYSRLNRVIDFVDVDSDKWRQYGINKTWPMNWFYLREGRHLFTYERKIAREYDASFFVSKAEADYFKQIDTGLSDKISYFCNGVDTDYFNPAREYPMPYTAGEKVLVFVGAMDYWANVDAVKWFATQIFPVIRAEVSDARFYIVGSRPDKEVCGLAEKEGVVVTGRVGDVRPYLAHAVASVAPLRIARGTQNKVLEAMAMDRPVIATSPAASGITDCCMKNLLVVNEAADIALTAVRILKGQTDHGKEGSGRRCVLSDYNWATNLKRFEMLMNNALREISQDANTCTE